MVEWTPSKEGKLGEDSTCSLTGHPWDLLPVPSLDPHLASRTPCSLRLLISWYILYVLGWIFARVLAALLWAALPPGLGYLKQLERSSGSSSCSRGQGSCQTLCSSIQSHSLGREM